MIELFTMQNGSVKNLLMYKISAQKVLVPCYIIRDHLTTYVLHAIPVIECDGSVFYIFLIFEWFLFLIFPICHGLRFLNFSRYCLKSANSSLFQINIDNVLYSNIAIHKQYSYVSNRRVHPLINFQTIFHPTRCYLSLLIY